jgi:hypothetical protein
MMKVGPLVGIVVLILGLMLIILAFLYLSIIPPPRTWPLTPQAAMARDEESPDFTLKIIKLTNTVKISDVELVVFFKENNSAFMFDLEDITTLELRDNQDNITYYDENEDGKLTVSDSLILKIDYDGPNSDGNNDGNFTNEGPFSNDDVIRLIHKKTGGMMCEYTIKI